MGSCGYQSQRPPIDKIDKFFGSFLHENAVMSYPHCDRFGQIQSLKTKKDGIYRLIMAAKLGKHTVKMDTVSVQCRIMNSLADFELYEGANFELQSALSPIIDPYDKKREQVYFHINTAAKHNYIVKILKFDSFRDVRLKQGIYQISLHQSLSRSQLVDHFIMSRGTMNALVMVFKYFQSNLLDIMQYRRQTQDYGWSEPEIMYIWMKIIKGYRELRENNIYHRDIRLSNIFYTPANTNEPLHFVNLSSARRMVSSELAEDERELMTVRGVSPFAQSLKGNIEAGQELADYDPHKHDLTCLQRLLLSILNLDPLQQKKQCPNQKLGEYLTKLRLSKGTNQLSEIENSLSSYLLGSNPNLNLALMLDTDKEISQDLSKKLLPKFYQDLTPKLYLGHLLLLHKRDTFNKFMLQKIEENEKADRKELNLDLLHQIGQYYESIGIPDNDYYKEEIVLVLDLAKEFRLQHFMQNHEEYLEKAMLLMEKYRYKGEDLRIRLKNQVVYSCLEAGDINEANEQLNTLLNMAHKENTLELDIQAEVFLTKAMVETTCHMWESAEVTLEKAALIVNENKNFVTQNEAKRMKGDLYMLEGYHYLRFLKERKDEVPKPKYLGLAETSINGAIHTFTNLPETPTNTIRIIDAYLLQAGLEIQRQRYTEAKKSLDAATLLLEELSTKHTISVTLRRIVYEKLKFVMSPTDVAYNTVCRRLTQYSDAGMSNAETHLRLMNQVNESKKQQRNFRKLQKSIIITEEPLQRQADET